MLLPNVWGAGQLFAFSGLDGKTNYKSDFVATLIGDKVGFQFQLGRRRELFFNLMTRINQIRYDCVASDIILADLIDSYNDTHHPLSVMFVSWDTLLGETARGFPPQVIIEDGESQHPEDNVWIQSSEGEYTALVTSDQDESIKFAFAYSPLSVESAVEIAKDTLKRRVGEERKKKLSFFEGLPQYPGSSKLMERTFYKCFSVLKVNVMNEEGEINGLWTTPDRVPHRKMWLLDSALHSFGLKYISPELGYRAVEAVLDTQKEDGFIAHMIDPYGETSNITQPPLLTWAIWELFETTGDKQLLERNYPRLKRYIEWDLNNRDSNNNHLCEWQVDKRRQGMWSGESAMDNSPRFENGLNMDAIDFSSFVANEVVCLEKMAKELGLSEDEALWHSLYSKIKTNVNEMLWDEKTKFYYDRDMDGNFNFVKTVASFAPMFAGIAEPGQAKALVEHLTNKVEFATEFPIPSVAKDEPTHSRDMWRGPTWINHNYMVMLGLKRYGYDEIARELADKTLEGIAFWYKEDGVIFEYYDCDGVKEPMSLDRKGPSSRPYDLRKGSLCIRDYGWTSALFIATILKEDFSV